MSDVIIFPGETKLDIPVDRVLSNVDEKLESVMVIGWTDDVYLYLASSSSKMAELVFLLEKAKQYLLDK